MELGPTPICAYLLPNIMLCFFITQKAKKYNSNLFYVKYNYLWLYYACIYNHVYNYILSDQQPRPWFQIMVKVKVMVAVVVYMHCLLHTFAVTVTS